MDLSSVIAEDCCKMADLQLGFLIYDDGVKNTNSTKGLEIWCDASVGKYLKCFKQGKFENAWNKSSLIYTEKNFVFKIQCVITKTVIRISKYLIKES